MGILALSPIWGMLLFKALRRRRRRTVGTDEERSAGAWDDVVDYATDTGLRAAPHWSRSGKTARTR